jgi:hypothetical protein
MSNTHLGHYIGPSPSDAELGIARMRKCCKTTLELDACTTPEDGELHSCGKCNALFFYSQENGKWAQLPSLKPMTPEDREAQRRSFAFGNISLSNPAVTRELVDRVADEMQREP